MRITKRNDRLGTTEFVIFGGAGDLTWRKLLPALFDLSHDRNMPADQLRCRQLGAKGGRAAAHARGARLAPNHMSDSPIKRKKIAASKSPVSGQIVFLFDVDNTLLDNDRVTADLKRHLEKEVGQEECRGTTLWIQGSWPPSQPRT